ncbi:MAG TPA: hypothetical protein VKV26_00615 [Dehalococcoidia bacterium]|nr:hypothetical protein [Dehalococcoidia bacterium]
MAGSIVAAAEAAPAAAATPASSAPAPWLQAPLSADAVPDTAIAPAGATLVRRVNLAAVDGRPDTIVAYWQTVAAGGCAQPRIVVFRPDAGGQWAAVWDASAGQNGNAPLVPASCDAAVGLFAVRPLDASGTPFLVFSATGADGSQRVIAQALDDPAHAPSVVLPVAAAAQISLADGLPGSLQIETSLTAPDGAGLAELRGEAIGRTDDLFRWQDGGFALSSRNLTLNCLAGSVLDMTTSANGLAIAFRCPAGPGSAVTAIEVTPATQIAPNLLIGGLRTGDDISVSLLPPGPDAAPGGLPVAAQVSSQSAAARQAASRSAPAPAPAAPHAVVAPPATSPQPRQPVAAPVPTITNVAAPAAEDNSQPAPSAAVANTTIEPPARPIPLQPVSAATARPIPQQGR